MAIRLDDHVRCYRLAMTNIVLGKPRAQLPVKMAKETHKNCITVDAKFTSFEELENEITKYQHKNYLQFYRRHS